MKSVPRTFCLTGAMLFATQAGAQTVVPPAQIDPGRVQQQARPPEAPRELPKIVMPEIPQSIAPEEAEHTRITLSAVRVEGATVYDAKAFDDLTTPLIGHEISLADAFRLADAITARYRRDDYILSRAVVPAQRIENGVLRIQVVEGFVSKVAFQGDAGPVSRRYARQLTAEKPLRGKVLERYLLLMNDLPGQSVRAVLAPSPDEPGGSLVTIVADRKPVDAYAGFDNHGSRYIGPLQYYTGVAANGVLGLGERIAVNYAGTAQSSELHYVNGQIDLPLGNDGLLLSANAGYSHSRPGFTLKDLDARASGTSLGARVSYPLLRTRAQTLRLTLAFHYLDSRTVINDLPEFSPSAHDRIRALRLGASYDVADGWGGQNLLAVEYSQGLSMFGSLSENRPNPSRPGARNRFHKLTAELSRRQNLDSVMRGLGLYGAVKAQTSFGDSLFSSEQFGVGGGQIGTAYDPSEIIGDSGLAARAEVQYAFALPPVRGAAQVYGFYDAGTTRYSARQVGEPRSASLSSAGGGVRFSLLQRLSGFVEVAQPLTRDVQTRVLAHREARPTRVFVGLTVRY